MSCSCIELEARYGQGDCKCARYRKEFPDCSCEYESVSEHSPGPVSDSEVLVRTLFSQRQIDQGGRLKPVYFRPDPATRGFSVDRMRLVEPELLKSSKRADLRYDGYLKFIATYCRDVRNLLQGGRRLFCVYDSATAENKAHADICQNVHVEPGTQNRKSRMMAIAWQLRSAFRRPEFAPQTSLPSR